MCPLNACKCSTSTVAHFNWAGSLGMLPNRNALANCSHWRWCCTPFRWARSWRMRKYWRIASPNIRVQRTQAENAAVPDQRETAGLFLNHIYRLRFDGQLTQTHCTHYSLKHNSTCAAGDGISVDVRAINIFTLSNRSRNSMIFWLHSRHFLSDRCLTNTS